MGGGFMRGKAISSEEDMVIRLGLQKKKPVAEIASFLNRAPASIYKRIERMKEDGEIAQVVADLGQFDEKRR